MPYQQVPFQYSCHTWQSGWNCDPSRILAHRTSDPRFPLVESLLDVISDVGSVVDYSASFERNILESLADFSPEYAVRMTSIHSEPDYGIS